ncbi:MAG: hypothetical protein ACSW76_05235 [Bacteroidaceae bacterium]
MIRRKKHSLNVRVRWFRIWQALGYNPWKFKTGLYFLMMILLVILLLILAITIYVII